jgi:nitrite reductase/ring-hydroxylating ferredoxin subunit/uncharacterized membrane protein
MKDFLEGKPLRHPLHPILVHFPIALFALSFLLDVASFIWPDFNGLVAGAFYSIALGVVTALLAAIPGFVDYTDIRDDHPGKKYATAHMILNLMAVGIYAINLGFRYSAIHEATTAWIPFFASVAGIVLLSVSGYLGGAMIYDEGISVGRHRRKTPLPEKTLKISSATAPKQENFVEICSANEIQDRETLRVDLDGVVMTIAKFDGQFYAFQEFCTHRFGPLSEGCLHDGQIQCPWHNSHFDLRTGRVTRGPAKTDLKTFAVRVHDGKIFIARPEKKTAPESIAPPPKRLRRFSFPKLQKKS